MLRRATCFSGLLLLTLACATAPVTGSPGTTAPHGSSSLSIERIFQGGSLLDPVAEGRLWLPDSSGLLFRYEHDGVVGLERLSLQTGETSRIANWSALLAGLADRRPEYEAPNMGDVNRTGRFSFEPVLSPTGLHLCGTHHADLFLMDLTTREVRFLTGDTAPELSFEFSPDGGMLAFVRDGELHCLNISTGESRQLTVSTDGRVLNGIADWAYEEELGVRKSFWWSPDSERIAYLQYDRSPIPVFPITDEMQSPPGLELQHYPKAGGDNSVVRLGVLGIDSGETEWVDTGAQDAYLPAAGWVNEERLWFELLNRDQTHLELRYWESKNKQTVTVLMESAVDWVNVRDEPVFLSDGSFLWTAERDGWRHIYQHDSTGRLIGRLTRGEWQVEALYGVDADEHHVYFQGTEKDPRERHVYRTSLADSSLVRLTQLPGTHSAELSPDGTKAVLTHSSTTAPPSHRIVDLEDSSYEAALPGGARADLTWTLAPVEFGELQSDDGTLLYTAMLRPTTPAPAKGYPVLVYVYGGPHAQTVRNIWGGKRHLFFQYMAQRGYVVFWLDNRGSWGRGKAFEAPVHRRLGEVELADQLVGIEYLKGLPDIDPERIGVYGGSYGGFMALNCLLRAPEHFRAGVAWAPVTDWRFYDTIYTERYMGRPAENPEGYDASAPLRYAQNLRGALLLAHGVMDNNVHFQNSVQFIDALIKADKQFELRIYPRTRHSGSGYHFYRAMADFLFREL